MELLTQLGVNQTIWIQLATFFICFVFLKYFLFDPYFAAYNERKDRTLGQSELAERFVAAAPAGDRWARAFGERS